MTKAENSLLLAIWPNGMGCDYPAPCGRVAEMMKDEDGRIFLLRLLPREDELLGEWWDHPCNIGQKEGVA